MKKSLIVLSLILVLSGCAYNRELVVINDDSKVYHKDNCIFVKKASKDDILLIGQNFKGTVRAHFRPCKTCNPPDNTVYIPIVIGEIEAEISRQASRYRTTPEDWMAQNNEDPPIWAVRRTNRTVPANPLTVRDIIRMDIGRLVNEINQIYKAYRIDKAVTIEDYL